MSLTQKIGQVITLSTLIFGSFIPTAFSANILQKKIQESEPKVLLAQKQGMLVCTSDKNGSLNLRTRPSLYSRVIRRIPRGSAVIVQNLSKPKGKWFKVKYRKSIGWVHGDYLCFHL
ncbi:MAG: SH3 domain-containing protein [Cyanobacteria bacterium P01_H01_bin.150]